MMSINRRDFLVAGALGLVAAGLPRMARGADYGVAPFKTVLKKALTHQTLVQVKKKISL